MWKMEEYRAEFLRDIHTRRFPLRAEAMFKKPSVGKYTLYGVLEALYRLPEYKGSGIAERFLKRLCDVKESRVDSVLLHNIPQRKDFKTGKGELGVVCLYVKVRRAILIETLSKLK